MERDKSRFRYTHMWYKFIKISSFLCPVGGSSGERKGKITDIRRYPNAICEDFQRYKHRITYKFRMQ